MTHLSGAEDAEIRLGTASDASYAAALHAEGISEGFLPSLGPAVLTRLYRRIAAHPRSFFFVARRDDDVLGFAAGTESTRALYRAFLVRDGAIAGAMAAPRLFRNRRRVWETLRYPSSNAELPDAELLAMAVAPGARRSGVGRSLVGSVTTEFQRRGGLAAKVVTSADNSAAQRLYEACGFTRVANLEVHAGTASVVLTWP